jgi:transaldolase
MTGIMQLGIKIFADGADLDAIRNAPPFIRGFTTNPTLMRKAGVTDYKAFCLAAAEAAKGLPISFEVFADDLPGMAAQAREIASWGENVYVKIPVMNTEGESTASVIWTLAKAGVKINVTAVMTEHQVAVVTDALSPETPAIISVFAGRITDTGLDAYSCLRPMRKLRDARCAKAQLLWASARSSANVGEARESDFDIITLPPDLIAKLPLLGKNLDEYSRETVEMFRRDALAAGYEIPLSGRAAA